VIIRFVDIVGIVDHHCLNSFRSHIFIQGIDIQGRIQDFKLGGAHLK